MTAKPKLRHWLNLPPLGRWTPAGPRLVRCSYCGALLSSNALGKRSHARKHERELSEDGGAS